MSRSASRTSCRTPLFESLEPRLLLDGGTPYGGRFFCGREDVAVGNAPGAIAWADFNGDGVAGGEAVEYVSPVGEVRFDAVADVSRHVTLAQSGGSYELAVPLSVVGLDVAPGLTTRGDIGVLIGNGMETRVRLYWANQTAGIVSDVPSEAKLAPAKWGHFRFE